MGDRVVTVLRFVRSNSLRICLATQPPWFEDIREYPRHLEDG